MNKSHPSAEELTGWHQIEISGLVQGVGFRPLVYKLANQLGLHGQVLNAGKGVWIQIYGSTGQCQQLINDIKLQLPRHASIDSTDICKLDYDLTCSPGFQIQASNLSLSTSQILPDQAVCPDCLTELFDPSDRRHGYGLSNCTYCGPRYSVIRQLPYDRQNTTLAHWPLCSACQQEYDNPADRRFHAQPVSCPECGPPLYFINQQGEQQQTDIYEAAAELIQTGGILAMKGLGGFHLVCDANNPSAVERLRQRKHRPGKPFAVMMLNPASVALVAELDDSASQLLSSPQAPIVILNSRTPLPDGLAPSMNQLGVMLPYTPMHYLLLHALTGRPAGQRWLTEACSTMLVMTSANLSGNPLISDNQQALSQMTGIADGFLMHDRDISFRGDDSVIRATQQPHLVIRRARGLAPERVQLANNGASVIALGSELKNTFCLTRNDQAFVSQYIGDLDNPGNREYLRKTLSHLTDLLSIDPKAIIIDRHPQFFGQQLARELSQQYQIPVIEIAHHAAHAAAVIAEHQLTEPAIALTLDGLGLGDNLELWGGECLLINPTGNWQRLGHFAPLRLPGGDQAARKPWRLALAFLHQHHPELAVQYYQDQTGYQLLVQMLEKDLNCPQTTSAGRWFDLVAAITGLCSETSYEAEAAMLLESAAMAGTAVTDNLPEITCQDSGLLDPTAWVLWLAQQDKLTVNDAAATFHYQLAAALVKWAGSACRNNDTDLVILAGGCWQNGLLTQLTLEGLRQNGLKPSICQSIPSNDSGLSLGQAWLGRHHIYQGE